MDGLETGWVGLWGETANRGKSKTNECRGRVRKGTKMNINRGFLLSIGVYLTALFLFICLKTSQTRSLLSAHTNQSSSSSAGSGPLSAQRGSMNPSSSTYSS